MARHHYVLDTNVLLELFTFINFLSIKEPGKPRRQRETAELEGSDLYRRAHMARCALTILYAVNRSSRFRAWAPKEFVEKVREYSPSDIGPSTPSWAVDLNLFTTAIIYVLDTSADTVLFETTSASGNERDRQIVKYASTLKNLVSLVSWEEKEDGALKKAARENKILVETPIQALKRFGGFESMWPEALEWFVSRLPRIQKRAKDPNLSTYLIGILQWGL